MIKGKVKNQIAGTIFVEAMTALKNTLKQAEDRYDGDINAHGYRWYKSFVMDQIYPMMERQFEILIQDGLVIECGCGASVKNRNGWRPCQKCSGSGYTNSEEYNEFLYQQEIKGR